MGEGAMRSAYQSAGHPERMQLVFTTQLHYQLQTLARGRELHAPPPPPPHMRHTNGNGNSNRNGYANGSSHYAHASRTREINAWELEKKVVLLKEVRPLLEVPCFLYAENGDPGSNAHAHTHARAKANVNGNGSGNSNGNANGNGLASFFSMDTYFTKTLPLVAGQLALLDVWAYLLDMCECVPVRNRTRSLYLHAISCICRRVEFIPGYVVDNETITVDDQVQDRYYELLGRCLALCNAKLTQSRIVLEENALFMAHIFSTVCMRFPYRANAVFDAVEEATRVVEDNPAPRASSAWSAPERRERSQSEPLTVQTFHPSGGRGVAQKTTTEREQCRSPRATQRSWNGLSEFVRRNSEIRNDERVKGILRVFSTYKQTRREHTTGDHANHDCHATSVAFGRRTVESSLCRALEADMKYGELITPEEVAFIQKVPILHVFSGTEKKCLARDVSLSKELELGLTLFTERLQKPARDEVLLVYFIGAFLCDRSYWCDAAFACSSVVDPSPMRWHCVPGYFCVVRAFVAMFKRMSQRRPRATGTPQATVGTSLSFVHGHGGDVWSSYWTNREVTVVMDALCEVAKNTRLINTFVEIVLEGTNILDPASVNYALANLQRVLETAAAAAIGSRHQRGVLVIEEGQSKKRGSKPSHRGSLGAEFDDVYFCSALRKALSSSHVQILLKTLTFLYSCLDLLPSRGRRLIISELVIRDNFFRFFLHWNEEIRKIYIYIIVFKVFASSRLDLPCTADHVLLSRSPFFHANASSHNASLLSGSASGTLSLGYWSHLSDIAQSMLKPPSSQAKEEQRRAVVTNGLTNLIAWESHGATVASSGSASRVHRRVSLFHASLDDDDISVDLLVASKLDASLKMLADQVGRKKTAPAEYFPVEQEAYAKRALSQYVSVLWEYYAAAFERPATKPPAPKLEFTISSPFAAE